MCDWVINTAIVSIIKEIRNKTSSFLKVLQILQNYVPFFYK